MDTVSQPGQAAVEAFNAALTQAEPAPEPVAAEPAPPPEPPPIDPATIRVPETASLPKHAEKFKGKSLPEVFELNLQTERWASQKAEEAAQLRRELEAIKAQVAEQQQQPVDVWAQAGVDPDQQTFNEPRRVFDTTLSIADQIATQRAEEKGREIEARIFGQLQQEREANLAIATFEAAKHQLRQAGYDVSDEDWRGALDYIAPNFWSKAQRGEQDLRFEPTAYVHAFRTLRGAPAKPSLPQEGTPPVATRPATGPSPARVPTVSREKQAVWERIANAMTSRGLMSDDDARQYVARAGEK